MGHVLWIKLDFILGNEGIIYFLLGNITEIGSLLCGYNVICLVDASEFTIP